MENIVIIGAGIAGLSSAELARKTDNNTEITMITDEEYYPYYRIKLSKFVGKDISIDDIYIHDAKWYEDKKIKILMSSNVSMIDTNSNTLILDDGRKIKYTKLIIASGSSSFVPSIKGTSLSGVFTIRKFIDVININEYIKKNNIKNAVIIGGGLLGIEAAWSLKENCNINVNIIENHSRILPRQMDEEGSDIIEKIINDKQIVINKNAITDEIVGKNNVEGVLLKNGENIPTEMIIISAGVRSNVDMLNGSRINVGKGIIVDDNMKTNIADIYAAGDAAVYNGKSYGIWPAATEQGKIAGANASGMSNKYREIAPSNLIQVVGINVFSTGNVNDENTESIKYNNGIYTKLFFKKGIICGAILIGDTKKGYAIKKLIEDKKDFSKEISNKIDIIKQL